MHIMRPSPGIRRFTRLFIVLLAVVGLAASCTDEQFEVMLHVNASRDAAGRADLNWDEDLGRKAQAWAEHLARQGYLSHSNLSDGAPAGWQRLGENVGYGPTIASVHQGYMNSSGHRANILDSRFNYIGVGYAKSGNRVYTVQVFMKR